MAMNLTILYNLQNKFNKLVCLKGSMPSDLHILKAKYFQCQNLLRVLNQLILHKLLLKHETILIIPEAGESNFGVEKNQVQQPLVTQHEPGKKSCYIVTSFLSCCHYFLWWDIYISVNLD